MGTAAARGQLHHSEGKGVILHVAMVSSIRFNVHPLCKLNSIEPNRKLHNHSPFFDSQRTKSCCGLWLLCWPDGKIDSALHSSVALCEDKQTDQNRREKGFRVVSLGMAVFRYIDDHTSSVPSHSSSTSRFPPLPAPSAPCPFLPAPNKPYSFCGL